MQTESQTFFYRRILTTARDQTRASPRSSALNNMKYCVKMLPLTTSLKRKDKNLLIHGIIFLPSLFLS